MAEEKNEVTLAKALKLKNLLKKEVKEKYAELSRRNRVDIPEGQESGVITREGNVSGKDHSRCQETLEEIRQLQEEIACLKAEIDAQQNAKVRRKVYKLAEKKAELSFLQKQDFTSGNASKEGGIRGSDFYVSVIDADEAEQMKKDAKKEIESLQDDLDQFNQQTKVTLLPEWFPVARQFVD